MSSTATPRFETMTTGGLLDRVFRLYTANFPLMLGITAAAYVPYYALQLSLQAGAPAPRDASTIILQLILGILWITLTLPIATGAATYAISERYLGNQVTIGASLSRAFRRLGALALAQLSMTVRVMIGFLLLIVPGLLWILSYSLVVPVVMIEGRKAEPSLKRSRELVKGNRKKVAVVLFVVGLIQGLAGFGIGWITHMFVDIQSPTGALLGAALVSVAQIVFVPLAIIADILLYYDFRIRKEGFDLEMLSRDLAPAAANAENVSPAALSR